MQSSTKTQSKIIETITQMLKSSPNSFKTLVECIPHLNPTIIPSIISFSSLSTDPNTLLSFYKWCQTHIPNFTNPSTSLLPPLIRFKKFTDTKSILLSFIAQDDKHLPHDRLIHPPRKYPTPSKSLLDTPLLPVCFAFAVFELRLHLFQMSPSSRFLHSISKTLNLRTSSSLFANQNYRICKPNSSFTSPLLSSQRSLSTIAESPLPLPSEAQGKDGGGLSRWLLFCPGAITFGLGTWQIVRRQDKIEMLEFRRSRLGLEPLDLTSISSSLNEEPGPLEFRRVLCEGVFDDNKSIYVGPRSRSISGVTENGYYVITPLMPVPDNPASVQAPILVNRGWVPRSWRDKFLENSQDDKQHSPPESPHARENEGSTWWKFWSRQAKAIKDQGPVTTPEKVIGVIRESEKPSIFVPTNDPSSGQWFYVDVPMIGRACGLPENTVYIEDIHDNIDPSKPYPLPKDVNTLICSSVMPQDHLNYMLTWYSLSAAVTFMAYKRLKTRKSRK